MSGGMTPTIPELRLGSARTFTHVSAVAVTQRTPSDSRGKLALGAATSVLRTAGAGAVSIGLEGTIGIILRFRAESTVEAGPAFAGTECERESSLAGEVVD